MMNYDETDYMEVLKDAGADYIMFECGYPCEFLSSMAAGGFEGFLNLRSDSYASAYDTNANSDYCTGNIHVSGTNHMARINVHKNTVDKYTVSIIFGDANPIMKPNPFVDAVDKMGG